MSVLYILVPVAVILVGAALGAFIWATRQGQFDDLATPSIRAVVDDAGDPSFAGGNSWKPATRPRVDRTNGLKPGP